MNIDKEKANLYSAFTGVFELTSNDFTFQQPKKQKTATPVEINHTDFKNTPTGLVLFYAPWCGHCQKMTRHISELAIQFRYIFPIGAVNCENKANYPLCNAFKINAFPVLFQKTAKNTLELYIGNNDKDSLLEFIYQNTL